MWDVFLALMPAAIFGIYNFSVKPRYINAILLSRQTDAGEEIAQGLALGLSTQGGQHKYIYEVYKNIDQVNSNSYTEFAKSVIGITNWSEVIQPAN